MQSPEGVIIGGWSYVVAAFSLTVVVLGGYALNLMRRLRRGTNTEQSK